MILDKDLKLNNDHDLVIKSFDLKLNTDNEIVAQRIKQALLLFKGDWFLDIDLGVPYYEEILGQKNSIDAVRAIFIDSIKKVDGVKDLTEFEILLDDKGRNLQINFTVIDELNNIISLEV